MTPLKTTQQGQEEYLKQLELQCKCTGNDYCIGCGMTVEGFKQIYTTLLLSLIDQAEGEKTILSVNIITSNKDAYLVEKMTASIKNKAITDYQDRLRSLTDKI